MNTTSALVIGATGLVGSQILNLLLEDPAIQSVRTLTRRPLSLQNSKLDPQVINFDDERSLKSLAQGDVLFSAMGTTLKQAGSFEAQRKVDFDYQLNTAKAAQLNGAHTLVLISASGTGIHSPFPYSRMKAELEEEVKKLGFERLIILKPGLLEGIRPEKRTGEVISAKILHALPHLPGLEVLRPTSGLKIAEVCLKAVKELGPGVHILGPKEIWA